jgi:hypothetical protein
LESDEAYMDSLTTTDLRKAVEPSLRGRVAIVAGQGLTVDGGCTHP